ncbi:MAG: hypothetical protein WD333_11855 [Dehalococcoidia bacterium]
MHTLDLRLALGLAPDVPNLASVESMHVLAEIAALRGQSADVLLALSGRRSLANGFSLLG